MIAYLHGTPRILDETLTVLVGGVGYGVSVTTETLSYAASASEITLEIYTHVREDALELFGFRSVQEKKLFTLLIAISGVGPKTALAITGKGSEGIVQAVQTADIKFFSSVPRVGKKLSQKIIIDLKSKLGSIKELQLKPLSTIQTDLSEALVSLGFNEYDIDPIIRSEEIADMTLEHALQYCLKKLSPTAL